MATKMPRLNVVMEPYIYSAIVRLSRKEKLSLSLVARDLLREALTIHEDAFWAKEAKRRESSFRKSKGISHKDAWASWA